MCVRLRAQDWTVWRIDAEMTAHDAALTRFSQWWQRTKRAGHAFLEGAVLHGAPPERHFVAETRRALLWGASLPLAIILGALTLSPWALLGVLIYPLPVVRIARRSGDWPEAAFLTLGKFAEVSGMVLYLKRRLRVEQAKLIEYK